MPHDAFHPLLHAYHVFADGSWREPVAEHMAALEDAGFHGRFMVGIVGSDENVQEALTEISTLRRIDLAITAQQGWEQVTLCEVRKFARRHPHDLVLYAHTKGAYRNDDFQDSWRRSMTQQVIGRWHEHAARLDHGDVDAIGCHWLTAQAFPGTVADTPFPMFGGNFWAATCQYLRQLPPVPTGTRHDAEAWIGLNDPRVIDLLPGWPGSPPFPRIRARRLIAGRQI